MPPKSPDPGALLCENCGYPLDGIPLNGSNCPECGMPTARSHPKSRPGTAWQRRPGPGSLLLTWMAVLARPRAAWSDVAVRPRPAASLLLFTLGAAALLPALAAGVPTRRFSHSVGYSVVFFVAAWLLMLAMTSIEFTGIRFFGRQRGWRITPTVALVICAHAAVGWLVGGAGVALAWLIGIGTPWVRDSMLYAVVLAPFLVGMCVFSLLAGAGFHALRYANDPAALARRSGSGGDAVQTPADRPTPTSPT